jgi:hypothetical protein
MGALPQLKDDCPNLGEGGGANWRSLPFPYTARPVLPDQPSRSPYTSTAGNPMYTLSLRYIPKSVKVQNGGT